MTILEASYIVGLKETTTSDGESITSLVSRLYGSYKDICYRILQVLNPRFDWYQLPSGVTIKYLDSKVLSNLTDIL